MQRVSSTRYGRRRWSARTHAGRRATRNRDHWHSSLPGVTDRLRPMFIRSSVEILVSPAAAAEALRRMPADWIPGLAVKAQDHGHRLLAEVGLPVGGVGVGKESE